jgi:hypothetical protein
MDRIPYIASIIQAFMGPGMSDQECIKIFIDLKNSIHDQITPTPSSGAGYLFFLAAFNADHTHGLHSTTNQLTVFHLSECLTVINSYKTSNQRRGLLISKDEERNMNASVISSLDLPALEVSAALHVLASILKTGVGFELRIIQDVLQSALQIFFKIVVHSNCPSNIRKAYLGVLLELYGKDSKSMGEDRNNITWLEKIQPDLFGSIILIMKKFKGEVLKDSLHMMAPSLAIHSTLCTQFVTALLSLPQSDRSKMLEGGSFPNVSWDLPFLFDPEYKPLVKAWHPFGILMGTLPFSNQGTLKIVESTRNPLSLSCTQLLHSVLSHCSSLEPPVLDVIFDRFADHLVASLGVEESSQVGWDVFALFMTLCTPHIIIKVLLSPY